jgi:hypothetical protein
MSRPRDLDTYHRERRADVEAFSRSRLGMNGEHRGRELKDRFSAISRRYRRAMQARKWMHRGLIGAVVGGGVYFAIWMLSPWSVGTTVRHFAAGVNCKTARAVGLAPAVRGGPGYWSHSDADNDGIACEPWPRRR